MICYVDGSSLKNGRMDNVGGFGVVVLDDDENVIELYQKRNYGTTNNVEELRAILYVFLKYGLNNPIVYSDSAYCVNSLNQWIWGWERNGWLKSDGNPPENLEYMKTYYEYYKKGYRIDLRKVAGHKGIKWNEMADKLATFAINLGKDT